uniref:Putative secreted protein n=1 Tax=Panstrongylus lignarius TaxID=156445 RepID=A0A224Y519_9HEMI
MRMRHFRLLMEYSLCSPTLNSLVVVGEYKLRRRCDGQVAFLTKTVTQKRLVAGPFCGNFDDFEVWRWTSCAEHGMEDIS